MKIVFIGMKKITHVQKAERRKTTGKHANMEDKSLLLLWCWIRALYQMLTDQQKKEFAEKLVKELMEIQEDVNNVNHN